MIKLLFTFSEDYFFTSRATALTHGIHMLLYFVRLSLFDDIKARESARVKLSFHDALYSLLCLLL